MPVCGAGARLRLSPGKQAIMRDPPCVPVPVSQMRKQAQSILQRGGLKLMSGLTQSPAPGCHPLALNGSG